MVPRRLPLPRCAAACVLVLATLGCASHSRRTEEARSALDAALPAKALKLLNKELKVKSAQELPEKVAGKNTVLLLDRAMVLQMLGQHELSSRDLEAADKALEVLDFSRNALDDVARYTFSDSAGPYKAPAYEKLMVNTMNMVNYLQRGDLNGARVEARRLAVMQKYVKEHEDPAFAMLGPGSYFAGFTFERSNKPQEALRYYDEALQYGNYTTLRDPVTRLSQRASYSSPRLERLMQGLDPTENPASDAEPEPDAAEEDRSYRLEDTGGMTFALDEAWVHIAPLAAKSDEEEPPTAAFTPPTSAESTTESATAASASAAATDEEPPAPPPPPAPPSATVDDQGELLVIVSFGRVPAKEPRRIPVGLALTYASDALAPADVNRANELALQGLVTWVNFPAMGEPRGTWGRPTFQIDGRRQRLEGLIALDQEAYRAFEEVKGAIVASAITRMLARVVAGQAAKQAGGDDSALGLLLSLGTQAALTAADTPDTRSWSTLPARIAVGRVRLPPGKYEVVLEARGYERWHEVTMKPRGWATASLTALR